MPLLSPFMFEFWICSIFFVHIELHVCPKARPKCLNKKNRVSTRKKNVTPTKVSTKKIGKEKKKPLFTLTKMS